MNEQLTWPRTARRDIPQSASGTTSDVLAALETDADELDQLLTGLEFDQWRLPTPADGWTIAHQVAHLAATFKLVWMAVEDNDAFKAAAARIRADFDGSVRG